MSKWKEYTFRELLESPVRNGIYKKKEFHGCGCKIVNMGELFAYPRLKNVEMKRIELTDKEKEKYLLEKGDLRFARRSLTAEGAGKCSLVHEIVEETTFESSIIRAIPNHKKVCSEFLYYYFNSKYGKYLLGTILRQVAVSGITGSDLMGLVLKIPPLPEQKAIATVLSSLDDKIDLLHRQNQTLEALAETLFRQWFVEEAEEDWKEESLYDVIELIGGGTPNTSTEEYWGGNIKWISAKDITPNHKQFIINTEKEITELGLQKSSAKLISKYSTIISARGTVGKYCLLSDEMTFSQSNYGIQSKFKDCCFFTYLLIAYSVEELQSAAYGSVFDTITTKTFKEHKVNIPLEKEIIRFEKRIKPFFLKMEANSIQIQTLSKLRDTLLPKLMSGEVRVQT